MKGARFFTVSRKPTVVSFDDTWPSNIDSLCVRIDDSRGMCSLLVVVLENFSFPFLFNSFFEIGGKWNRLTCPCCSAARPLSDYSPWTDSCCCTHSSVSLKIEGATIETICYVVQIEEISRGRRCPTFSIISLLYTLFPLLREPTSSRPISS